MQLDTFHPSGVESPPCRL